MKPESLYGMSIKVLLNRLVVCAKADDAAGIDAVKHEVIRRNKNAKKLEKKHAKLSAAHYQALKALPGGTPP